MRKYLMAGVATAALMFGVNQTMAQSSMGGGTDKQGATSAAPSTSKGSSGAMDHSTAQGSKTIGQARDQDGSRGMSGPGERSEGSKTIGQSREQSESKGMQPSSKMGDRDKDKMGDNDRTKSKTTTGQSRDEMKNEKGAQSPSSGKMGAQPSTNQNNAQAPSSSSSTKMGQQPSGNENRATTGSASSSATQLTTEQRTEVREKVLTSAPRENNVNFSVNVGTVVPRTVHVAEVPETLIRIHPDWRGHRFFVVRDEIIIVDNDFRIIAVLPV
jgi:hypothetical protein